MTAQDTAARAHFPAGVTVTQGLDGDGQEVVHRESGRADTYYLRSGALGGAIVAEINASGQRLRSYAYGWGGVVVKYDGAAAPQWRHSDPVTGSERWATAGGVAASTEYDPVGADAGVYDWPGLQTELAAGAEYVAPRYVDALDLSEGCEFGNAPAACGGEFRGCCVAGVTLGREGASGRLVQAATSKKLATNFACRAASLPSSLFTCPFLILCAASTPSGVRPVVLFDYVIEVLYPPSGGRTFSFNEEANASGQGACLPGIVNRAVEYFRSLPTCP